MAAALHSIIQTNELSHLLKQWHEGMVEGRADAISMLTDGAERHLMAGNRFRTKTFIYAGASMYLESYCYCTIDYCRSGNAINKPNFTWLCSVITDNSQLVAQANNDSGDVSTDDEGEDEVQLHHFEVDTGVRPDVAFSDVHKRLMTPPYGSPSAVDLNRAKLNQFTPEGLKTSWIRAFPAIRRGIRKLKRCKVCKARVQPHAKCVSCVISE